MFFYIFYAIYILLFCNKQKVTVMNKKYLFLIILMTVRLYAYNDSDKIIINVDSEKVLYDLDRELFGVCPMFWSESDKNMEDGIIEQRLKEINCRFLRFPGGTESDNFDWRTNRLVDKKRWPYSDGTDKMSIDEFIVLCKRIGAEPIICVNTELAFFDTDSAAVNLATEWVRYCNLEKKYNIKYWEIGNEPYYHSRFNATEYAELLVKLSKSMKSVDPRIKIAAVGEWNPEFVGVKEQIANKKLPHAQEMELFMEMGKWEYSQYFHNLRTNRSELKWWPEVMRIAREYIDVASIHWYYSEKELEKMTEILHSLNSVINPDNSKKNIELIMTEWSLHENIEMYGLKRALTVGEAIGRMSDGFVRKANYWPLRCGGSHDKKGLLSVGDDKTPHANFYVIKMFSKNIGDKRIFSSSSSEKLYHFATKNGNEVQLFVINRSDDECLLEIKGGIDKKKNIRVDNLKSTDNDYESDRVVYSSNSKKVNSETVYKVDPWSMNLYEFKINN